MSENFSVTSKAGLKLRLSRAPLRENQPLAPPPPLRPPRGDDAAAGGNETAADGSEGSPAAAAGRRRRKKSESRSPEIPLHKGQYVFSDADLLTGTRAAGGGGGGAAAASRGGKCKRKEPSPPLSPAAAPKRLGSDSGAATPTRATRATAAAAATPTSSARRTPRTDALETTASNTPAKITSMGAASSGGDAKTSALVSSPTVTAAPTANRSANKKWNYEAKQKGVADLIANDDSDDDLEDSIEEESFEDTLEKEVERRTTTKKRAANVDFGRKNKTSTTCGPTTTLEEGAVNSRTKFDHGVGVGSATKRQRKSDRAVAAETDEPTTGVCRRVGDRRTTAAGANTPRGAATSSGSKRATERSEEIPAEVTEFLTKGQLKIEGAGRYWSDLARLPSKRSAGKTDRMKEYVDVKLSNTGRRSSTTRMEMELKDLETSDTQNVAKKRLRAKTELVLETPPKNGDSSPKKRSSALAGGRKKITLEDLDDDSDDDPDFRGGNGDDDASSSSSAGEATPPPAKKKLAKAKTKSTGRQVTPKRQTLTKSGSATKKAAGKKTDSATKKPGSASKKQMTPQMAKRSIPVSSQLSPLQEAQARLHVCALPDSLPCRENEFAEIYAFTEGKIVDGTGGCMYISGVPGTGKTATVKEVMRTLTETPDLPPFNFVEINGMRLTEPSQAYVQIWKLLTGQKATAEAAHNLLEKRFSETPASAARATNTTILLVDELDMLWNRKQSVLYNLFEWPTRPSSALVVLAVANTMDLPERLLLGRVQSRLGLTRLAFAPYTHAQLQAIVSARLSGLSVFDSDAVQLVARKVASLSGDARRALDICRRATEIADRQARQRQSAGQKGLVGLEHVAAAHQEMFTSPKILAIRMCSRHEQLFLQAVVSEFRRTGVEEATFERVFSEQTKSVRFEGMSELNLSAGLALCHRLSACRLLMADGSGLRLRIRLNVAMDDVIFALDR